MLLPDKVGFAVDDSDITLIEGASRNVCVKILDLQPSDIYPMTNIPLSISTSNISAGIVCTHNGLYWHCYTEHNYDHHARLICTVTAAVAKQLVLVAC